MAAIAIRVLGAVAVHRDGVPVSLPRSRKLRALLAVLALAPAPMTRTHLCDLLWDGPSDPRGELRWTLSKLRGVLGDERIVAGDQDTVSLTLAGCTVDALEVAHAVEAGVAELPHERLVALREDCMGELLEGLQVDGSPELDGWLVAQRQRLRRLQLAIVEELVRRGSSSAPHDLFAPIETWLRLAPYEPRAHEALLHALVRGGRTRDAEEHLAAAIRQFEHEGLDWQPLRDAWRAARTQPATPASARGVVASTARVSAELAAVTGPMGQRRASVAIMPFTDAHGGTVDGRRIADGLTDDIITRLAKLRVLFVIARGTVYALRERDISAQEAGRILNVDYIVSGQVRRADQRLVIKVELAETCDAHIVWADELHGPTDDAFAVLDRLVDRIAAGIADEIETAEIKRAIQKPPSSLDAWEAYHRGLWHMYRFSGPDNQEAERSFRAALALDPSFARAHAGLSFTHFQSAFLDLTPDRDHEIAQALHTAASSVAADDRDPAAHWAMGRALWLRGAQSEALPELQRSIELSPNFALGHYTLGFVQCQSGDPRAAIAAINHSRELSPFDPLQFGMLASRALAHVRLGELAEAAEFATRAAARPNAHVHILAIAAECLALANRRDEARQVAARVRARLPHYRIEDLLRSFRFDAETERLLRRTATSIDFG